MFNINRIIREEIQKYIDFFGGKKIKAVIFDFDFTLVDSTAFAEVKKYAIANRDFSVMFEKIPEVKPFNGIKELISKLKERNILVLVVTNNKQDVAKRTLDYHGVYYNAIRGAQGKKMPKHKRMLALLGKAGVNPEEAISVGDLPIDELESNQAGINFVGCTWGNNKVSGINNPLELIKIIDEYEQN